MRSIYIGFFLVDKLVAGGLDDWEVKIADFVVALDDKEGGVLAEY